jgi:hypothetical protein
MRNLLISLFLLIFITSGVKSQVYAYSNFTITVNEICNARIYPAGTIYLGLLASRAGTSMDTKTNASTYFQMTSIIPATQKLKVSANVSGIIPAGTKLQLTVGPCTTGDGARGNVSSSVTLATNSPKDIITNIGSCYTGTTATSGYNLYYSWGVDPANVALLKATPTVTVTITYTVSAV